MAITFNKSKKQNLKQITSVDLILLDLDLINFVYQKSNCKENCVFIINSRMRPLFYKKPLEYLDKDFIITKDFLIDLVYDEDYGLSGFMTPSTLTYNPTFRLNQYYVNKNAINIILNEYMTVDMLKEYELDDLIKLYDMYSIDKPEEEKKVERVYIEFYSNKFKNGEKI